MKTGADRAGICASGAVGVGWRPAEHQRRTSPVTRSVSTRHPRRVAEPAWAACLDRGRGSSRWHGSPLTPTRASSSATNRRPCRCAGVTKRLVGCRAF